MCEDVNWLKQQMHHSHGMSPRSKSKLHALTNGTGIKTQYVAEVTTKEEHKGAYETLRYASFNPQQDAKIPYKDVNPAYRIDEDIWGRSEDASLNDLEWMKRLFVPTCVRNEFWLA